MIKANKIEIAFTGAKKRAIDDVSEANKNLDFCNEEERNLISLLLYQLISDENVDVIPQENIEDYLKEQQFKNANPLDWWRNDSTKYPKLLVLFY